MDDPATPIKVESDEQLLQDEQQQQPEQLETSAIMEDDTAIATDLQDNMNDLGQIVEQLDIVIQDTTDNNQQQPQLIGRISGNMSDALSPTLIGSSMPNSHHETSILDVSIMVPLSSSLSVSPKKHVAKDIRKDIQNVLTVSPTCSRAGRMSTSALNIQTLINTALTAVNASPQKKKKNPPDTSFIEEEDPLQEFFSEHKAIGEAHNGSGEGPMSSSPRVDIASKESEAKQEERRRGNFFKAYANVLCKTKTNTNSSNGKDATGDHDSEVAFINMKSSKARSTPTKRSSSKSSMRSPSPGVTRSPSRGGRASTAPSPCFLSVGREKERNTDDAPPPIGHYRPKYAIVDHRTPFFATWDRPVYGHQEPQLNNSNNTTFNDSTFTVDQHKEQQPRPATGGSDKENKDNNANGNTSASRHDTSTINESMIRKVNDSTTSSKRGDFEDHVRRIRTPSRMSESFVFASKVPAVADPPKPASPDKFYNYDINVIKPRTRSAGYFDQQPGRAEFFKDTNGISPNRDYNPKYTHVLSRTTTLANFDKQVDRGRAAAEAQARLSRKTPVANPASETKWGNMYPADNSIYNADPSKIKPRTVTPISMDQQLPRSKSPTGFQGPAQSVVDPSIEYRAAHEQFLKHKYAKTPSWNFEKLPSRPPTRTQEYANLEYEVNIDPVRARTPSPPPIAKAVGRKDVNKKDYNTEFYNPKYEVLLPRAASVDFSRTTSRETFRSPQDLTTTTKSLDKFYDTKEIDLKFSRPKGDPFIRSQLGREELNRINRDRTPKVDTFYDYDPTKFKRSATPQTPLDWSKYLNRESKVERVGIDAAQEAKMRQSLNSSTMSTKSRKTPSPAPGTLNRSVVG